MRPILMNVLTVASLLALTSCESSSSPPTAQRMPAPPAGASTEGGPPAAVETTPGAPSLPQTGEPTVNTTADSNHPAASTGGGVAPGFLAAHLQVEETMLELITVLDGVTDEATAQAAAPRIAALTPQWKDQAQAATAAYLVLRDDQEDSAMQEAAQQVQSRIEAAPERRGGRNFIEQTQRIAAAPYGASLHDELQALRDAFLTTRGIYSPTRARQHVEEKLGPVGSPIKTN